MIIYSARKWARLALSGNPTILLFLFVPDEDVVFRNEAGAHINHPELVAEHGYDTKYAMHALRLGFQGAELLTTGRITLPIPEPQPSFLRSVRRGDVPLAETIAAIEAADDQLTTGRARSPLPEQPERQRVDAWLHRAHLHYWSTREGMPVRGGN